MKAERVPPLPSHSPSPTEITDLGATAAAKAVVRSMVEDLLMPGGDVGAVECYTAPGYVQHNVEHWDNVEPVPPPEELVNSGKF